MKDFIDLKPCPFCGSEAELRFSEGESGKRYYWVPCKKCSCCQTIFDTPQEAGAAWNARPIENELVEKIEKLEAEIKRLREALAFYAELDGNGIQLYGDMDSEALEFVDGASQPFGKIARDALKAGA